MDKLICLVGAHYTDIQPVADKMGRHLLTLSDWRCYPTQIKKTLEALRDQGEMLIWTHNPLILDEFSPEDAYLVCPDRTGEVLVTRFADMPQIQERLRVYSLGALWVSYCDGLYEEPLRLGLPRPAKEGSAVLVSGPIINGN